MFKFLLNTSKKVFPVSRWRCWRCFVRPRAHGREGLQRDRRSGEETEGGWPHQGQGPVGPQDQGGHDSPGPVHGPAGPTMQDWSGQQPEVFEFPQATGETNLQEIRVGGEEERSSGKA